LDFRNGWTSGLWPVPVALQIAGLVIAVLAYALTTWAMTVNAYFSKIVRIQDERGHSVATDGPYQVVRHPGYLGTLAFELGTSIMLGSLWALVLSIVSVVLFIVRTALEDRMLQDELAGYAEYAKQVRYRLIPGVW
jgi:protein-S-isoprenylcysteine O-methyltransferase Ste14